MLFASGREASHLYTEEPYNPYNKSIIAAKTY